MHENETAGIIKFDVHCGMIFEEFLTRFNDLDVDGCQVNIQVILPNGTRENAIDAGGVFRDCLTEFWDTFFNLCTLGTSYKVPIIRPDFKEEDWNVIAKILVKGWKMFKYFPINLAIKTR